MTGIITAMESEAAAVRSIMAIEKESEKAGCRFWTGTIEKKPAVLCLSGVGKALAAMAATIVMEQFHPDQIINAGVAGGFLASQHPLDLVVGSEIIQADYDTVELDGPEGLGKRYPVRDEIKEKAKAILDAMPVQTSMGPVASQDLFMAREEDIDKVLTRFPESAIAEMEAGAIAQVCAAYGIDFICVRSLSDIVRHESNHMEFSIFVYEAAKNTADFIQRWMKD